MSQNLYVRDGRRFVRAATPQILSAAASLVGKRGGAPVKPEPCPKCGREFGVREMRRHKPRCNGDRA